MINEGTQKLLSAKEAGVPLLGEIVTWSIGNNGSRIDHTKITSALTTIFDEKTAKRVAKDFAPKSAFVRACRKMSKEKVINILDQNASSVIFQFNRIERNAEQIDYGYEAKLTLDKHTGHIDCTDTALAERATGLLAHEMANRNAMDITTMVQKLMRENADLFSVRDQGGCYFVPQMHCDYVDKVEGFVKQIGGRMNRLPIADFTQRGKLAVKEIINLGLDDMVADHVKAVDKFDEDTRVSTMKRRAEIIKKTEFKLECYAEFLQERKEHIVKQIKEAKKLLSNKLASAAAKSMSK